MAEDKWKIRTVRLDDEVWAAVKAMNCSLNQYLRSVLLGPSLAKEVAEFDERRRETRQRINQGARRVPVTRSIREKGDGKR